MTRMGDRRDATPFGVSPVRSPLISEWSYSRSSGGAYIAVHAPGNVMGEAIRISASALEHVVRETVSVFRPNGS